jgi:oxidase EvaA
MNHNSLLLLKSLSVSSGVYIETGDFLKWLKNKRSSYEMKIKKIPFSNLRQWSFCDDYLNLQHETRGFFSVTGINVATNLKYSNNWDQPIINQPEIGYLGFISQEINGVLHFLVQAKIEPGNINNVQISPTLQATKSNYSQAHNGNKPKYLDYFINVRPDQVILDQLQSEQGARFFKKRNRNIVIKVDDPISLHEDYTWLTLAQIKKIMRLDSLVNMDTRTVLSCISIFSDEPVNQNKFDFNYDIENPFFKSAFIKLPSLFSLEEIIIFLTRTKLSFDLEVNLKPLNKLNNWIVSDSEIFHVEKKYFKVIALDIEINNREVSKWTQPMIESAQNGLCGFICKEINGILHFIVQAKLECGNFDIVEFAPTVQCLTGDYRDARKGSVAFLDYLLNSNQKHIYYDTYQSEEGGRFYQEQNRNMIVLADKNFSEELPENYIWMTLHQINIFLKFNNYFNIQARSLISAISFEEF